MKIHVTEHKSSGSMPTVNLGNAVRVFVDHDYHYGYFVDEHALFAKLSPEQQVAYLEAPSDIQLDVPVEVAQHLVDIGVTPYIKPTLRA